MRNEKAITMRRVRLNINKLFPEAARRVEILRELRKNWVSVVGPALVRHSFPSVLGVNTITVAVEDQNTANMITKMKGNIRRALTSHKDYEADENFTLKIGVPLKVKQAEIKRVKADVEVDEEKVNEYTKNAPETLPEDINFAISHLKVFLDAKFSDEDRRN